MLDIPLPCAPVQCIQETALLERPPRFGITEGGNPPLVTRLLVGRVKIAVKLNRAHFRSSEHFAYRSLKEFQSARAYWPQSISNFQAVVDFVSGCHTARYPSLTQLHAGVTTLLDEALFTSLKVLRSVNIESPLNEHVACALCPVAASVPLRLPLLLWEKRSCPLLKTNAQVLMLPQSLREQLSD